VLQGSIVPLVTPFSNGQIDDRRLKGLIERQIDAGSHGISVGGTTGEPASLSLDEREYVVEASIRFANGKAPVLAGTGTVNLDETIRLTRAARSAGAAAGLIIAPYYVKPNQEGLYNFFAAVAEAVPDLPLVIYNIPGRTAVDVQVGTLARLARACPNIVGVKHSVKDLDVVSWTLKMCGPGFSVYCGFESLTYPMLALGGHGMIAATGNWLPEPLARMYDHAKAGRHKEAVELHFSLLEANDAIFWDTNPIPLKTVLAWMGLVEKEWRLPLGPTTPEIETRLRRMAEAYGLIGAGAAERIHASS
jgi:4-hydroxy-tetrahydrodipicolinate synthase